MGYFLAEGLEAVTNIMNHGELFFGGIWRLEFHKNQAHHSFLLGLLFCVQGLRFSIPGWLNLTYAL